tara:strand:+ start:337 stop:540 length:204 start_codon:yes stop_codon:yes gene_type:complete
MTTAALVHEHELKAQHSAHAANIALLLRTPAEGAAARERQLKTIDNLRNQMVQIDTQLMRISCAQEV